MFSGDTNWDYWPKMDENNPVEAVDFIALMILFRPLFKPLKFNEPRHTASFVVSRSIKKLFLIDYVSIYSFSMFFSVDFQYRDSLTLKGH